jgi:putative cell wall-binding protein
MTVCRRLARESVPRYLALLGAMAMLLAFSPMLGVASADAPETEFPGDVGTVVTRSGDGLIPTLRFRGLTRFDTAHLIAEHSFGGGGATVENALMARGDLFPDALAGNFLAGQLGAPILLTATDFLVPEATEALETLDVQKVFILGGRQAISEDVEGDLNDAGYETERLGGLDRYETASLIASRTGNTYGEFNGLRTALIAFGDNFPDALVTGGIAYDQRFPLLLTNRDFLNETTADTLQALEIEQVIIAGGTGVVAPEVEADLADIGVDVERRLAGTTRVDTAVEVAQFAIDEFGWGREAIALARGNDFPDALTMGPRQGQRQQVLILTVTESLLDSGEESVANFLRESGCELRRLDLAGGFAAITEPIEDEARALSTTDVACDVTLTPESATNPVGETHTVTVDVDNNGGGDVEGEEVNVTIEPETGSAALPTETSTVIVTGDGDDEVSFTSPTPGDVVITACFTNEDGEEVCDTASKTFVADGGAALTGLSEIDPDTGLPGAGDLDANGESFVAFTATQICLGAVVEGLDTPIVASHIHDGPAGENGPVVVDFTDAVREGSFVAGCTDVEAALLTDIQDNPDDFYVNVHTADFPAGAIRGQLFDPFAGPIQAKWGR